MINFKTWLNKRFKSQAEFCRYSGVPPQTVNDIMTGKNKLSKVWLWAISLYDRIIYLEKILKKHKIPY